MYNHILFFALAFLRRLRFLFTFIWYLHSLLALLLFRSLQRQLGSQYMTQKLKQLSVINKKNKAYRCFFSFCFDISIDLMINILILVALGSWSSQIFSLLVRIKCETIKSPYQSQKDRFKLDCKWLSSQSETLEDI